MKVKFYYSTKDKPGEQYPCNIAACLDKVKTLKAQGRRRRGDRRGRRARMCFASTTRP